MSRSFVSKFAVVVGSMMALTGCSSSEQKPAEEPTQQAAPLHGCATPTPTEAEAEAVQQVISQHRSALAAVGSINIPVYAHVINKGTGIANGDISDAMIADQIAVLNAAYASTPLHASPWWPRTAPPTPPGTPRATAPRPRRR